MLLKLNSRTQAKEGPLKRHNPHPSPSPLARYHLGEMTAIAERCYHRGWAQGTAGNFSVRDSRGVFWQSPSGQPKGNLAPEAFLAIDLDTGLPIRPMSPKPSDETPLHGGIYRRYSNAQCVVHVHPPQLVRTTQRKRELIFSGHEMSKALGARTHQSRVRVPVFPNSQDMVTLSNNIIRLNLEIPVVILQGHGVYSWGRDSYSALAAIEALEFLCQTTHAD